MNKKDKLIRNSKSILVSTIYAFCLFILISYNAKSLADEIRDRDYQFVLRAPDSGWVLLSEKKVKAIVPDAIAGAIKQPGFYSVIIVEHVPSFTIEKYADTIIDTMQIEDKLVKIRTPIVFSNYSAVHTSISGKVRGIPIRYYSTIVKRGEWFYQFLGWGVEQQSGDNAVAFKSFVESITFTNGKVRSRGQSVDERVASGVGWMLDKGTFKSAAYGFEVTAPSEWRLVVGDELTTMSTDAEVGLIKTSPGEYIAITPERIIGLDKSKYSKNYLRQMAGEYSASPVRNVENVKMFGKNAEVYIFQDSNVTGFDYLAGIIWIGDVAYKTLAWFPTRDRQEAVKDVKNALASFKSLSKSDLERLEAMLNAGSSSQNIVGTNYSLRSGVYRDYGNRFLWAMPSGYWRLETGADARNRNEDAVIFIDSLSYGIYGVVIGEDVGDVGASDYHMAVRNNIWDQAGGETQIKTSNISIDGRSGLLTEGIVAFDEGDYVYSLATFKYGTRAIQISFWGLPGNMQRYRSERLDALRAFEFLEEGYNPASIVKNAWVDERLGFVLKRPGTGWEFKDETPDALRSVGTLVGWHKGGVSIMMLALCALGEEQDPNLMIEQMVNNLVNTIDKKGGANLDKRPTTFKGREAVRIDSQSSLGLKAVLFSRNRTAYAVLAIDKRTNKTGFRKMDELVSLLK